MAWLIAVDGEHKGRRFSLTAPCLVGRGPYNHVVLDDTRISRQHAKISPEKSGHVVYDLNSANGTYVNDVQVKRQRLQHDDVIRFGPFRFRFEAEEATSVHVFRDKFLEVRTFVGSYPPAAILDSLDAKLASDVHHHAVAAGLVELEDADRKLRTLYGFLQSIANTLDTQELLERVVANVLAIFPRAEAAIAYLPDSQGAQMEPSTVLARSGAEAPKALTLPPQFYDEVVAKRQATLSAPRPPGRARGTERPRGEMSMHAPMIFADHVYGVLQVRSGAADEDGAFNQSDLDLLTGLAAQAAMLLQNARMHQESLRQQRLQQDLLLAEQIQKSFLPRALPSVEGLEFITEYRPAYSVGGDFYDVFWMGSDRLGMFVGDVSGKGVSAALLMARVSSDLRLAAAADVEPARVLTRVNRMVLERGQIDTFVTVVFLTLDVRSGRMRLSNAGHPPPLLRRRGRGALEVVEGGGGTALGFFDDAPFDEVELLIGAGDSLVLYTDGVLEAAGSTGEMFGMARLQESAGRGASRAVELAARVLRDVRAHVGAAAQNDDLTLVVCGATDIIAPARQRRRDESTQVTAIPQE